jgi:hypothetical protein
VPTLRDHPEEDIDQIILAAFEPRGQRQAGTARP